MNRKQIIEALRKRGITFDGQSSTPVLNGLLRDSWLQIKNDADGGYEFEMTINGAIGTDFYGDNGYSAKQFQDELKPFKGKRGMLNIHSGGGNVWDGFAIAEMIRNAGSIDTKILGLAASAGDVIFQSGAKRVMPSMAMRMAHNASAYFYAEGNATQLTQAKADLDKTITRLEKHNDTLATMYANRSGNSVADVKVMMDNEEFMDGNESLEKGFCDELTKETPVTDSLDLSHIRKVPSPILNQFSAAKAAGKPTNQPKETTVNKQQKLALLNSWGVKLPTGLTAETVTDAWVDTEVDKGKPAIKIGREQNEALLKVWNVTIPGNATDTDVENLVAKGKPTQTANTPAPVLALSDTPEFKAMREIITNQRTEKLRGMITNLASEGRIPVNEIENWLPTAVAATDDPATGNPIVAKLAALPQQHPGQRPVILDIGDTELSVGGMDKFVNRLMEATKYVTNNRITNPDNDTRKTISINSKKISNAVRKLIQHDKKSGELIGPIRDAWDAWGSGIQNANTMSAGLLRQVILSEIMRAFKRQFASLNLFAHNYKDVALQGTDKVEVPYYPLATTASTEFVQATGYTYGANAVTNVKEIVVGGVGNNVASPGVGRKYQSLQFTAYEIARQPYLNIAQLITLAGEQLAIDVRGDILGANIKQANFGNAIWTGAAGAFDASVVTLYLQRAAINAFWPEMMRNMVLTSDFYVNLANDPYVKAFLNIGDTGNIRDGKIGGLYGFKDTIFDALLPITTFIQGGNGAVTAGPDLNLAGFICYPSAILLATAPIMPGPATMRLLASYEQVTDDQTGLTFSYQYSGNVQASVDNEIIECSYGSGLGELAALKRFTTAGV